MHTGLNFSLFYRYLILKISVSILVSSGMRALIICYEVDEWVCGNYCERGFPHPNKCLRHDYIRKAG